MIPLPFPSRFPPPPERLGSILLLALVLGAFQPALLAQDIQRSTFPGRRVGGGTRDDCTSRPIAHLVPPSSVFAPGPSREVALLEGPSNQPRPVLLEFRPPAAPASSGPAVAAPITRVLPAAPAGITLFTLPALAKSTVWSSSYRCGAEGVKSASDPLAFVESAAPPALSLVVSDVTPADREVQAALARLRQACGGTLRRQEVAQAFGLEDLISGEWPAALPVRCL